jgi:outer membrane lipopolysaccharide assembly protein LptE/RlpB
VGVKILGSARVPATMLLAALCTAGCGYRLAGTGASLIPEHIRKIVVMPFDNRTARTEIEQRVTEEVARELSRRGRYDVVTDRGAADAMLDGAITTYRAFPVEFGADSLATRVEAVVTLQATLRELATDDVLWSQSGLVFRGQFDVKDTLAEGFTDESAIALDEIARGAAGALVTAMFEGF